MKRLNLICGGIGLMAGMMALAEAKAETRTVLHRNAKSGIVTEAIAYGPSTVRILKHFGEKTPETRSFSIIANPSEGFSSSEGGLQAKDFKISADNDGNLLFTSLKGDTLLYEKGCAISGAEHEVDLGKFKISQRFLLSPDEPIYGLGQRQCPRLNQRGEDVRIWCGNTNITIPYFTSRKGYGVYWDNAGDSRFTDRDNTVSLTSEVADGVDYYFMYDGGTQDGVIRQIRHLTGDATMFPLWAMGHWQCRERYKSSDELTEVLDRYRSLRIPLDGIVQDWQYWGCDSNWNAMAFMNPHYINEMGNPKWMRYLPNGEDPNAQYPAPRIKSPAEMVKYVHDNNAHLMISIWASFGPWTKQAAELGKIGALLPFETWPLNRGVQPYDPFNPKARDIYWKYLKEMHKMGFDAWWTDSTEPDHWEKEGDSDHMTYAGSWRSVKNAYALMTNKGIYEHQRDVKGNNTRSLQMTRCGTFGLQHYGTFSWSGDVVSNWDVMKNQIPSGLNYVICGIPYWNTDIGGFFGWDYANDPKNPAMQELQVRWMQWGCFMPLMRNHCSSPMVSEIYNFGNPGEWAYDAQKKAVELRYRLLPYIYSNAGEAAHEAGTMMRPLVMDFAHDDTAVTLDDQYMFGHSLLVHPVTDPLYTYMDEDRVGRTIFTDVASAAAPVDTYLPSGSGWYDFWTNRLHEGGKNVRTACPIDRIPLFVKAGSIMAFGPEVQYAAEKKWDDLEIRVYPGADATFTLYEDDGESYDYEKGLFSRIRFDWNDTGRTLTVAEREGSYPGMMGNRRFRVTLVGEGTESGDVPTVGGKSIDYNGTNLTITL